MIKRESLVARTKDQKSEIGTSDKQLAGSSRVIAAWKADDRQSPFILAM